MINNTLACKKVLLYSSFHSNLDKIFQESFVMHDASCASKENSTRDYMNSVHKAQWAKFLNLYTKLNKRNYPCTFISIDDLCCPVDFAYLEAWSLSESAIWFVYSGRKSLWKNT